MKIIIFSHESDIDGLGSIVLGKLAFGDIDYELFPNSITLEHRFDELLYNGDLCDYDHIFVTDLALEVPSIIEVQEYPSLRKKVKVFDHHKSAIDKGYNLYDFCTIMEVDSQGVKTCGTRLFYEYLCNEGLLEPTTVLNEFVELTRLRDTWDWTKAGELGAKACGLAIMLTELGIVEYIKRLTEKVSNKNALGIEFTEEEHGIIKAKQDEYNKVLKEIMSEAEYFTDENGNKFGAVFANYEYRSELVEYVRRIGNPYNIDYLMIVILDNSTNGQKSYRAIDADKFDVSTIALAHGGGGHPAASAVIITKEQKNRVLEMKPIDKRGALKYIADSKYEA